MTFLNTDTHPEILPGTLVPLDNCDFVPESSVPRRVVPDA